MVLFWLLVGASVAFSIFAGFISDWGEKFFNSLMTLLCCGFFFGFAFIIVSSIGENINSKDVNITYPIKIVSLQDGSQVEGRISGGLFVIRGSIGENEYFSYYQDNGNGSFSLDKRPASQSSIIPDATPETAHIMVTDGHKVCKNGWWYICANPYPAYFVHADFHVPSDSIVNNFVLDAK